MAISKQMKIGLSNADKAKMVKEIEGNIFGDFDLNKVDKNMLDWDKMPVEITNKNQFYKEVSKVFATDTQSIYMFGTPEELQRVWDIWGKPDGLKATHVYIAINAISNKSSRHSFIIWVFSSNYANPYFRIVGGYNGSYVSAEDKGWVNVNSLVATTETLKGIYKVLATDGQGDQIGLDYAVLPTPNTFALRQSDGTLSTADPKEDNDAVNLNYFKTHKIDAYDLMPIIEKPAIQPEQFDPKNPIETSVIVDYAKKDNPNDPNEMEKIDIRLDKGFVDRLPIEYPNVSGKRKKDRLTFQFTKVEMFAIKGIRSWVQFKYNGEPKVISLDIWFPKVSTTATKNVSVAVPNPYIFEQKVFLEIDLAGVGGGGTCELVLKQTGGTVSEDIELIDAMGIL